MRPALGHAIALSAAAALLALGSCRASSTANAPLTQPAPPSSEANASEEAPRPRPSLALADCRATPTGDLVVSFGRDYTAQDLARWLAEWSCRRVIIPRHVFTRTAKNKVDERIAASELPMLLDRMLVELDLVAVSEKDVTVFVDGRKSLASAARGTVHWSPREWTGGRRKFPESAGAGRSSDKTELPAEIADGIKKIGENDFTVERSALDAFLAKPTAFGRGARIVPSIKNGAANGFKLYAIRPSSIYARLGLLNGDTIQVINGHDVTTPDKVLEIYSKVREASSVRVKLTRRGKPVTIRYTIVQ